jgi:hypothetical protein
MGFSGECWVVLVGLLVCPHHPKKTHGRSNLDTCRLGMYYDLPNTFERNVKKVGNTLLTLNFGWNLITFLPFLLKTSYTLRGKKKIPPSPPPQSTHLS